LTTGSNSHFIRGSGIGNKKRRRVKEKNAEEEKKRQGAMEEWQQNYLPPRSALQVATYVLEESTKGRTNEAYYQLLSSSHGAPWRHFLR